MRSSRCPFGRLLGRNWFKCYRYFVTDILVWQRPPKFCVKVGCYYFATQLVVIRRGIAARQTRDPEPRWLPCRDSRSHPGIPACVDAGIRFPLARKEKPRRSGAAHSMRASAQVTAPGAATSMIVAVTTRPNRQNRSTCSRMSGALVQKQKLGLVNRRN
jgi:hypothetical protein